MKNDPKTGLPIIGIILAILFPFLEQWLNGKNHEVDVRPFGNEIARDVEEIHEICLDMPEEDRLILYKVFAGGAEYVSNADNIETNTMFLDIAGRVRDTYGWQRGQYEDLTDAMRDLFESRGIPDKPTEMDRRLQRDLEEVLRDLAEATKP